MGCLLGLAGCSVTQDFQAPEVEVKDDWRVSYDSAADMANVEWWSSFNDPTLESLIDTALKHNNDLGQATARVYELTGRYNMQNSAFYPQVGYGLSGGRSQRSLEQPYSFANSSVDRVNSSYNASLNIGWEIDVWGKLARAEEAARADVLAAEEGRQAVIMSLVSSVAVEYIDLLSLDHQLEIATQTVSERKASVELFERKIKGGQISELELAQVRSAYEQAAAQIPILELDIIHQENRLSVLVGKAPGKIDRSGSLQQLSQLELPQGLPSDLLVRRPDIRMSVQKLIAANARVGVAKTEHLPTLSLSGLLGYASDNLSNLFNGSAGLWEATAGSAGMLYTGGRIEGNVKQAEAIQQQLIYEYQAMIQTALREVDDSLSSIQKLRQLSVIQQRHVDVLEMYVEYAKSRHDAGYSRYMEVLDAERNLYTARINQTKTHRNIFASTVGMYKAMGGGWISAADELTNKEQNKQVVQ